LVEFVWTKKETLESESGISPEETEAEKEKEKEKKKTKGKRNGGCLIIE